MRRTLVVVSMVVAALVPGPQAAAVADPCGGRHHGGGHHQGCGGCPSCVTPPEGPQQGPADRRVYDPDTVTTLKGSIKAVTVVPARGRRSGGAHVTLESDGAATDVHLGPTWFLEKEGLKVAKGDSLEVTGSLVDSDGSVFMVAREVRKGATLYRLRDERGVPSWAGGPRRDD
jgi:hypothetical protein